MSELFQCEVWRPHVWTLAAPNVWNARSPLHFWEWRTGSSVPKTNGGTLLSKLPSDHRQRKHFHPYNTPLCEKQNSILQRTFLKIFHKLNLTDIKIGLNKFYGPLALMGYIYIVTCISVTIDGFWIDERIDWTVWYGAWLQFTVHCYTQTH
jgi:hypothetical protein